jgi:hypothetical protein
MRPLLALCCCLFLAVVAQAQVVEIIPVGTTTVAPPCDDAPDCDHPAAWETAPIIPNPGPVLEAGLKDVPTLDSGLKSVPTTLPENGQR